MNKKGIIINKDLKIVSIFFISMIIILILSYIDLFSFSNQLTNEMLSNSIPRLLGGIVFVVLMIMTGYKKSFKFNGPVLTSLFVIIPGVLIAVNNFPIIAYLEGRVEITEPVYNIYIFLIECFSISFFEEIVFRGIVLILLIQKLPSTKKGMYLAIFISSLIFGLSHLVNLFGGISLTDVLQQVGYSFLMGLMWAVVYLKTKNIWWSVLLHSAYNFFGLVLFRLGYVNGRYDIITVVTTIVLAILVSVFMLHISLKIDVKEFDEYYNI
jgi:membrane protease YdiL (CAAX protease family)